MSSRFKPALKRPGSYVVGRLSTNHSAESPHGTNQPRLVWRPTSLQRIYLPHDIAGENYVFAFSGGVCHCVITKKQDGDTVMSK